MRLILVRHAETPANLLGSLETSVPGPGLTELGHRQAEALADTLADEPIAALYVSDMVRTSLTAAPLLAARGLEPLERAGLREIGAGDLEGRTDAPAVRNYVEVVHSWINGDLDVRMPGSEDGHEFVRRVDAVVAEAEHSGDVVALVTHGATIWAWGGIRGGLSLDFLRHRHPVNTGVVVLEGSSAAGWTVASWLGESDDPAVAEGAARDRSPATHLDD